MIRQEINSANLGSVEVMIRDCPMCGQNNDEQPALATSFDVWEIKECGDCAFVYIDKAPDYEKLLSDLSWEHTLQVEAKRRSEIRPIGYRLSRMARFRQKLLPRKNVGVMVSQKAMPGPVLDLGCGGGGYISQLPDEFIPYGIEISKQLADSAKQRLGTRGGNCLNAPALEGLMELPDNMFSGAILRSYLEHELNPLPTLKELYRVLRPGGVAVIKVPNYGSLNRIVQGSKWCGFRYPDHLNYFTPRSLRAMCEKVGFQCNFGLTYKLPTSDNMYLDITKPG